jgi:hypothetical protein
LGGPSCTSGAGGFDLAVALLGVMIVLPAALAWMEER